MKVPKVNRSTLQIVARRLPKGVEVTASFEAPKVSGETGRYNVQVTIDPKTKVVVGVSFTLRNRKAGSLVFQDTRKLDGRLQVAREIRDIFLKSHAWQILKDRKPDSDYIVTSDGEQTDVSKKRLERRARTG